MDREQRVRERAHRIWEAEGCPEGCEQEHWERAEREIDEEASTAPADRDAASSQSVQAERSRKADTAATDEKKQPKRTVKRSATASAKTYGKGKGSKTPV